MKVLRTITAIVMMVVAICSSAATDTSTRIFNPDFRTLKIYNPENFMSVPVIRLGTDDSLVVSFDELGESNSYLRCRILHCNANWQPSQLLESEYLPSFNEMEIDDYAFSTNTFIHYVNYRIDIPNERIMPLVSGNYLLQVYPEDNPDETVLQVRFYVAEPAVTVKGAVTTRTDNGFNSEWQQLELDINPGQLSIRDPFNDVMVVVEQNGREETAAIVTHPQRIQSGHLIYEHIPALIFKAGNEYRRFETVRADYPGLNVDSVRFGDNNYHAWVSLDQERASKGYLYDSTQFGRYLVREHNSTDSDLGADYITVHFTLDFPELINADIYVDGEMTHGIFDDSNRMIYDSDKHLYELEMPLKQGSYNYRYIARPRNGGIGSTSLVEGDKYETCNEYTVRVYLHDPMSRADRLIGTQTIYREY